ncbi:hypothetical protein N1851_035191 [Merluccius polli]|nr:hypothetical protein N1851_035191 [Merluccius polli]
MAHQLHLYSLPTQTLEVRKVSSIPIDVLHEEISHAVKQKHPNLDLLCMAEDVTYEAYNYRKGMIISHGELADSSMAGKKSVKLLVCLSQDDKRKLLLPNGIPKSVEELVDDVRRACGLRGNFRIQYQDKDFGDTFVNLTSTGDLEDLCTIKVIPLPDEDAAPAQTQTAVNVSLSSDEAFSISGETDDTAKSVEELVDDVRRACGLRGNFRIQYQDKDFGDTFVNLTSTGDLEDLCTIKVIPLPDEDAAPAQTQTAVNVSLSSDEAFSISGETDDTLILSSSSSSSSRTEQWPKEFPIPSFSYDTEVQLERGNAAFKANGTRLTVNPRMKSDILEKVSDLIYKYKAYPKSYHFCEVSEALIKKHPCLAEPGSWNGCYGWTQRLKTRMGNLPTDDTHPAKNVKRPKRGEANHVPSYPAGETADNLELERQVLLKEVKKRNNGRIIREKMAKTFALRRQEIVEKQPRVEELQERWPAIFQEEEINAEFLRITTVPLQPRFLAGLDKHSSQLLQVIRKKGGAVGEKIRSILKPLDQGVDLNIRRECLLKSLVIYLGEDVSHLIKEYLVVQKEEAKAELENAAMAIFVLRDDDALSPPMDIGLVVDGVEVLNDLSSIASSCAMLFGLTYALNLSYPVELKYTFETFQKIIMDIESRQMSRRIQNLSAKLHE